MPLSQLVTRRGLLLAVLMLVAGACSLSDTDTAPLPEIMLTTTSLGPTLTDADGKTLYIYAADANGTSHCGATCSGTWSAYYIEKPLVVSPLLPTDFTTMGRPDGTKQTAYKGWPLYTYKYDTKAGDVLGENIDNAWFVAKPTYSLMYGSGQLIGSDGKSYTSTYTEGWGNTMFFVDAKGRTLYTYMSDRKNKNTYTKNDLSNNATWPMYQDVIKDLPSTLNKAVFDSISVYGKTQITFKGWPLYYFGGDNAERGSTKGVSVPKPGAWPVASMSLPYAPY